MKTRLTVLGLLSTAIIILQYIKPIHIQELPKSKPTPFEQFMDEIASIETPGGNHQTVNQFGMLGRYQFSPSTIKALGFKLNTKQFLSNKHLQDTVMLMYMAANQQELEPLITRYDGKVVRGIKINRASIIAGAHFAGSGGVKQFLMGGFDITDANGTTLQKYMAKFSKFNLPPIII